MFIWACSRVPDQALQCQIWPFNAGSGNVSPDPDPILAMKSCMKTIKENFAF